MAKKLPTKSTEEILWDSANKLRGSVEPSEYKHVVLSLIFLKFANDKFLRRRQELINEYKEAFLEIPEFYQAENVFYLPEESRWTYIIENAKQEDITLKVDTALKTIERTNKSLEGALPDNYFSRLGLDQSKFSALLDTINNIDTLKDEAHDIVGRVYEYFLSKFAIAEGKGKGEFYTPKSIVNLIAEMIEPYKGKIYDPSCGSGGMFVQSLKFIEKHKGNKKDISIYGQELTNTTYKLAKMNLAIRGISSNLGNKAADTFGDDQHKDLKADYIMANPPFNLKDWRAENELTTDPRWAGYEIPPKSNANYAWILNMISKLSQNGVAGFILANGALSGGGEEYKIRKQIIEKVNEQICEKLEATAQALYKHWFVDFEFPVSHCEDREASDEAIAALVAEERGLYTVATKQGYKSSGGKMVWNEELGKEIPEGWEVGNLSDLINVKYGKDYKHLKKGKIPLYGSGGIMSYVNEVLYAGPSVLIPRKGSLNNILYVKGAFWSVDTMFYSIPKRANILNYTFNLLSRLDFNSLNVGSAVPSMTTEYLNSMIVLIPNKEGLASFDNEIDRIEDYKISISKQTQKLTQLQSLLLSRLAVGEEVSA